MTELYHGSRLELLVEEFKIGFVASVPVPTCFEMTNVFIDFLKDWTLFDFSPKEVASEPLFVLLPQNEFL
jgi:hypothetical protein